MTDLRRNVLVLHVAETKPLTHMQRMHGPEYCATQKTVVEQWRNDDYQEKSEETTRQTCCSSASSVMNVTLRTPGWTPRPGDKESAPNRLNYGI